MAVFGAMVAAVETDLAVHGWFPRHLEQEGEIGEGAVLLSRSAEVCLHEQHEVGICRFGPVRSRRVSSVSAAVHASIEANGGEPIDGVRIGWDA